MKLTFNLWVRARLLFFFFFSSTHINRGYKHFQQIFLKNCIPMTTNFETKNCKKWSWLVMEKEFGVVNVFLWDLVTVFCMWNGPKKVSRYQTKWSVHKTLWNACPKLCDSPPGHWLHKTNTTLSAPDHLTNMTIYLRQRRNNYLSYNLW